MIKSIIMKNCVPYTDEILEDCQKVNFIFGPNGSGKTTISAFLAGDKSLRLQDSSIEWTSADREAIYVYNKTFKANNLVQTIPGVFTMGSATIEEVKHVEDLKEDLSKKKEKWNGYCLSYKRKIEEDKPNCENRFKDVAWTQILKKNEVDFQRAFDGFRNSKDRFVRELFRRIDNPTGSVCNFNDLKNRAKTVFSSSSDRCGRFNLDIQEQKKLIEEIRTNSIWENVIVGNDDVDLSALIKELNSSPWVNQGRKYIRVGSNVCPFCQQETITDEFKAKLESFFDEEYKRKVSLMNNLRDDYRRCVVQVITAVEEVVHNEQAIRIGKLDIELYSSKKDILLSTYKEHLSKFDSKIAEPGIKVTIPDITSIIKEIEDMLEVANDEIDKYNELVSDLENQVKLLTDDVWETCIHESDVLISDYKKEINDIEKAIKGISKQRDDLKIEIDKIENKISEKGMNITSVQPTIDEINRSLKAYGYTNFSIQPAQGSDNQYCIVREDGTSATATLSEGEETFLSFLYFMQVTKGSFERDKVAEKKIIVLDDPISSLDSTILYVVSAMVKDLEKNIRDNSGDVTQLFVLTHNVFFHKEVSFISGRTEKRNDTRYWIVQKNNGKSKIKPFGTINPVSTSYELLWLELQNDSEQSLISIQNTMRRIIENYFSILGNRRDDWIIDKFETLEEKTIARSLIYWINDGSHSIYDDLYIDQYTDAIPKYKNVFKQIFDVTGNLAHYNMMMKIESTVEEL